MMQFFEANTSHAEGLQCRATRREGHFKILFLATLLLVSLPFSALAAEDGLSIRVIELTAAEVDSTSDPTLSKWTPRLKLEYREDLARGNRLRISLEFSTVFMRECVANIVPLDAEGRKTGIEQQFRLGSWEPTTRITWVNDLRDGPEQHLEEKKLVEEILWKAGVMEGLKRTFHPNGTLRSSTPYHLGNADGETLSYDAGGKITRRAVMKNGIRHGLLTDYFPGSDQAKRMIPYIDGNVEGITREFYENGRLKREASFRNDLMHGAEKQFEANGTLSKTRYWINGDPATEADFRRQGITEK